MKKINRIMLCFLLMFACLMPFALCGCNQEQAENVVSQEVENEYKEELFGHLSKINYETTRGIAYNLDDKNTLGTNDYRVIDYGYFVNASGGFLTYHMYVGKNTTYILKHDKAYGKIENGKFYVATTSDSTVTYTLFGTVSEARSSGYKILTSADITEYNSWIKNSEYVWYKNYLLNLKTGELCKIPQSKKTYTEILFYKNYADFAFNNYFSAVNLSDNNSYYVIDNYPHKYYDDDTKYAQTFFTVSTIEQTIKGSDLPTALGL